MKTKLADQGYSFETDTNGQKGLQIVLWTAAIVRKRCFKVLRDIVVVILVCWLPGQPAMQFQLSSNTVHPRQQKWQKFFCMHVARIYGYIGRKKLERNERSNKQLNEQQKKSCSSRSSSEKKRNQTFSKNFLDKFGSFQIAVANTGKISDPSKVAFCDVILNCEVAHISSNLYARKLFLETELSYGEECKK